MNQAEIDSLRLLQQRVQRNAVIMDYAQTQQEAVNFLPLRKKNSHRILLSWMTYLLSCCRKVVETTGSLIERLLPKHIHAVTARGFELKVSLFVLAASLNSF